jgi:hypothetical protein
MTLAGQILVALLCCGGLVVLGLLASGGVLRDKDREATRRLDKADMFHKED